MAFFVIIALYWKWAFAALAWCYFRDFCKFVSMLLQEREECARNRAAADAASKTNPALSRGTKELPILTQRERELLAPNNARVVFITMSPEEREVFAGECLTMLGGVISGIQRYTDSPAENSIPEIIRDAALLLVMHLKIAGEIPASSYDPPNKVVQCPLVEALERFGSGVDTEPDRKRLVEERKKLGARISEQMAYGSVKLAMQKLEIAMEEASDAEAERRISS